MVSDNCTLNHCVIGADAKILSGNIITEGAVIGNNVVITDNQNITSCFVQSSPPEYGIRTLLKTVKYVSF